MLEVYDLDQGIGSRVLNISTRGQVEVGDNVMIGGVIVLGQGSQRVIVRAIGPSLPLSGNLANTTLSCMMETAPCSLRTMIGGAVRNTKSSTPGFHLRTSGVRHRGDAPPCVLHRDCAGRERYDRGRSGGSLRAELISELSSSRVRATARRPPKHSGLVHRGPV